MLPPPPAYTDTLLLPPPTIEDPTPWTEPEENEPEPDKHGSLQTELPPQKQPESEESGTPPQDKASSETEREMQSMDLSEAETIEPAEQSSTPPQDKASSETEREMQSMDLGEAETIEPAERKPEPKRHEPSITEPKKMKTIDELQDAKTLAEKRLAFWSQHLQKVNDEIHKRLAEENNDKEGIINDLINRLRVSDKRAREAEVKWNSMEIA